MRHMGNNTNNFYYIEYVSKMKIFVDSLCVLFFISAIRVKNRPVKFDQNILGTLLYIKVM